MISFIAIDTQAKSFRCILQVFKIYLLVGTHNQYILVIVAALSSVMCTQSLITIRAALGMFES